MRYFVSLIRIVVGFLFIFSGLVKTIDPIGFSFKLEEYFEVFGMPFLMDYALPISVFFVIFEIILGVLLLLGVYKKFTKWSLLLLIVFFSFLTFYSAYFNKVTDCGCFGDAIKLAPWQSFYKDLILLVLVLILFFNQKYIDQIFSQRFSKLIWVVSLIVSSYIAWHGIAHLPLVDFRAYAVGKSIPEGMKSAEELGLEPPTVSIFYDLKNKNTGEIVKGVVDSIYLSKYWSKDTPWEQAATREEKTAGYEPPIHDFSIECSEQGDVTYNYLEAPKVIFFTSYNPAKASEDGLKEVQKLADQLKNTDIRSLVLASDNIAIGNQKNCFMDPTTIKTIVRSNPGIVVLKKGVIVAKYHWSETPTLDEVQQKLND